MFQISRKSIVNFNNLNDRNFLLIISKKAQEANVSLQKSNPLLKEELMIINEANINKILSTEQAQNTDILYIPFGFTNRPFPTPKGLDCNSRLIQLICREDKLETSAEMLFDHLNRLEKIDIQQQIKLGDSYFINVSKLTDQSTMEFINEQFNTRAILKWGDYAVNKFYGYLELGETSIAPSGEINISPSDATPKNMHKLLFNSPPYLNLHGDIVLKGHVVLGRHAPIPYAINSDMKKLHGKLSTLKNGAIKLTLDNGRVTQMKLLTKQAEPAYRVIDALFTIDDRYRLLIEIGYSLDTVNKPSAYNNIANEFYGYENGSLHFGFGSNANNYHFDIVCPHTKFNFYP